MPEYIEREALLEELQEELDFESTMFTKEQNDWFNKGLKCAIKDIKSQPAADVVEVRHGEWKEYFAYDCWHYDCPFCDFGFATKIRQEDPPNYCENCGAKMDGKGD